MSNFGCTCGHNLKDSTDFLPYKAYFLPDEDTDTSLNPVANLLAEFVEAREQGKQDKFLAQHSPWLQRHRGSLRNLIRNLFSHPTFSAGRTMYECEQCGRLWLQARLDKNEWLSYLPESTKRGILRHEGAPPDD
jgi:hypothetical protein